MNYELKEKLIRNEKLGYETFLALNLDDNALLNIKLYLRPTVDESKETEIERNYWTFAE